MTLLSLTIILIDFSPKLVHTACYVSPAFKARSATGVAYVNEKRVTHKIPDKFVYQKVKMICIHYGTPRIKENSTKTHTRFVK